MNNLPNLILYKFLFNFEFLEDALLPEFKGSTIRGAFGWKLLKAVEGLYPVYEKIFETKGDENNPPSLRKVKEVPHPFILHPPLDKKRDFQKGELITVGITLVGYSHNFLPFFIDAFSLMGKNGITSKRKKLKLLDVVNEDAEGSKFLIYEHVSSAISNNYKPITTTNILSVINNDVKKLSLNFETPFHIRSESDEILEKDKNKITPRILVARLEERYKTLAQLYCRSTTNVKEIFRPDDSVTITNMNLEHYKLPRYSNRAGKKQMFLGLHGSIALEGNLKPILPLLYIGEKINIGNKSSFGWGQYKIELPD
jgi:hypothetical protein